MFSYIGQIDAYEAEGVFEVFDDTVGRFYYFSIDSGARLGKRSAKMEFNTRTRVRPGLYAHSKFGTRTGQVSLQHNVSEVFFTDSTDRYLSNALPYDTVQNTRMTTIPDFDFVRTAAALTYYRPFGDTLYQIEDTAVSPIATIHFAENPLPDAVRANPEIASLAQYASLNGHPQTWVAGRSENHFFITYQYGGKPAATLFTAAGEKSFNAGLLKHGAFVTPPPFCARNNRLLSVSSVAADKLLQLGVSGESSSDDDLQRSEMINADRDSSDVVLSIFTIH